MKNFVVFLVKSKDRGVQLLNTSLAHERSRI